MKKFNAKELLKELREMTLQNLEQGRAYLNGSEQVLNYREKPDTWSVLECLEHLNLYGDFYLGELEDRMLAKSTSFNPVFKSTWFANRTVLRMLPKENGIIPGRMNTFKDKNPIHSNLPVSTVNRFIKQQEVLLELIEKAHSVDMTRIKTAITLPYIKFRLGDTFRFVVYHNVRHMLQAKRVFDLASEQ